MASLSIYETPDGVRPFSEWFASLDKVSSDRIAEGVARFEKGNFGDSKGVGGSVLERRFSFGPGYRVYYGRDGTSLVVLLGGGSKRRQSTDIARAKRYWDAYLAEKRAAKADEAAADFEVESDDATGR